jgi:hypothetical protein
MFGSNLRPELRIALGGALAVFALAAPIASADTPAAGYEQFAGCPSPDENPEIAGCIRSEITGGHFQMGTKTVPIKNPFVLSGGFNAELGGFSATSKGGLTKVKQEVPGGVIGLTGLDWLVNFLSLEALKLYAVAELAGPPTNFSLETVTIPLKVHLINPVLGNNCYVGSNSNPIVLNLTTSETSPPPPNEPITGKEPEVLFDEKEIAHGNNGIYVDNAFSAPGASGCALTLFGFLPVGINGLINSQSGLPAPAGTNETIQNFNAEIVESGLVYP